MQPSSTLDDDEALARMLQYQEQTTSVVSTAGDGTSSHTHSSSNRPINSAFANTEQEQRDSELARRFAQMEMEQGIPNSRATVVGYGTTSQTRRASGHHLESGGGGSGGPLRAHSLDRQDSARRFSYPVSDNFEYGTSSASSGYHHHRAASTAGTMSGPLPSSPHRASRSFNEYDLQIGGAGSSSGGVFDPDASLSGLGDLEYARRLQEAAFARLHEQKQKNQQPGVSQVIPTAEERADMELARRMQEMENNGLGLNYSGSQDLHNSFPNFGGRTNTSTATGRFAIDEDERIARLMAATGKSLRDLQSGNDSGPVSPATRSPRRVATDARATPSPGTVTAIPKPASRRALDTPASQPATQSAPSSRPKSSTPTAVAVPVAAGRSSSSAPPSPHPESDDNFLPGGDAAFLDIPVPEKKKKTRNFLGFRNRQKTPPAGLKSPPMLSPASPLDAKPAASIGSGKGSGMIPLSMDTITGIPAAIPPPPGGSLSSAGRVPIQRAAAPQGNSSSSVCFSCGGSSGSFIAALEKKYHPECFRCVVCHELINVNKPFAFSKDAQGYKHPHHPKCFSQRYAATCCVCKQKLPANEDGTISFVKHPFFDTEEMCPKHALESKRRCTGCHRFEPDHEHFIDLDDGDRCICYSCCRSVVVDSNDAAPLWHRVISFFRDNLGLPIWEGMNDIPIMIVGFEALNEQLQRGQNAHGGSSQIMTRGLCLTDHANCGRFRLPTMRFNSSQSSFEASNGSDRFTYYDVPTSLRANTNSSVFAIMCLSGLPRDLTASVLAHEATHAWIKMHPDFDANKPIPAQVEEGVAQLMALLFLNEGLDSPAESVPGEKGPSDAKLRQYFRFSIETEENEVYGTGYRRAAAAYQALGIEALMMHVVRYRDFPHT